jgi:hypothetical protein
MKSFCLAAILIFSTWASGQENRINECHSIVGLSNHGPGIWLDTGEDVGYANKDIDPRIVAAFASGGILCVSDYYRDDMLGPAYRLFESFTVWNKQKCKKISNGPGSTFSCPSTTNK